MCTTGEQGKRWFKCHWFYRPEDTTNRLDARVVRTERQARLWAYWAVRAGCQGSYISFLMIGCWCILRTHPFLVTPIVLPSVSNAVHASNTHSSCDHDCKRFAMNMQNMRDQLIVECQKASFCGISALFAAARNACDAVLLCVGVCSAKLPTSALSSATAVSSLMH